MSASTIEKKIPLEQEEENSMHHDDDIPNMTLLDVTDGANERETIPKVKFIDHVQEFCESFQPTASAELVIGAYTELFQKYKTFEGTLLQREQKLTAKVPELSKSVQLIESLIEKKGTSGDVRYSLAENIYAKATVDFEGSVHLWLGANVMLEFTYEEALDFLQTNLSRASKELEQVSEDLAFVRDQIVTTEVTMSRVFNWDVRKRRQQQNSK